MGRRKRCVISVSLVPKTTHNKRLEFIGEDMIRESKDA